MNISKGTIVRTITLVIALFNEALHIKGVSPLPIENEMVESLVSDVFLMGTAIWTWWKNNSFTSAALEGDEVVRQAKVRTKVYKG